MCKGGPDEIRLTDDTPVCVYSTQWLVHISVAHLDLAGRLHSQTVVAVGDTIISSRLPEPHDVVLRAWPQGGTSVCPSHYKIGYLSHRLHGIFGRRTSLFQPVAHNLFHRKRRSKET